MPEPTAAARRAAEAIHANMGEFQYGGAMGEVIKRDLAAIINAEIQPLVEALEKIRRVGQEDEDGAVEKMFCLACAALARARGESRG